MKDKARHTEGRQKLARYIYRQMYCQTDIQTDRKQAKASREEIQRKTAIQSNCILERKVNTERRRQEMAQEGRSWLEPFAVSYFLEKALSHFHQHG